MKAGLGKAGSIPFTSHSHRHRLSPAPAPAPDRMLLQRLSMEAPNSGPFTFIRPAQTRKKARLNSYAASSSTPGIVSPPPGYGPLPHGPSSSPPGYGSGYGSPPTGYDSPQTAGPVSTSPSPEAPNRPRKRKRILVSRPVSFVCLIGWKTCPPSYFWRRLGSLVGQGH